MEKLIRKDYKRLNRVFDVANIKYDERPPPAYTRAVKPSIENVTSKKRGGGNLTKKISKKRKATPAASNSSKSSEAEENLGQNVE